MSHPKTLQYYAKKRFYCFGLRRIRMQKNVSYDLKSVMSHFYKMRSCQLCLSILLSVIKYMTARLFCNREGRKTDKKKRIIIEWQKGSTYIFTFIWVEIPIISLADHLGRRCERVFIACFEHAVHLLVRVGRPHKSYVIFAVRIEAEIWSFFRDGLTQ